MLGSSIDNKNKGAIMNLLAVVSAAFFVAALQLSVPVFAVSPDVLNRGWKPSVEFSGAGDTELAVDKMREMAELQQIVFQNTEYHQQTQAFVDGLWASLERFNLKKFYRMLPDQRGEWRQLEVFGQRDGDLYRVGPNSLLAVNGAYPIQALGDLVSRVRAKEVTSDIGTSYLLNNDLHVGVGAFSWDAVISSVEETLRLTVVGDQRFGRNARIPWAQDFRMKVQAMNPLLGERDVEIIAPLWAAFPESWSLLSKLGRVQNVIVEEDGSGSYQHLVATFELVPDLMIKQYPELAGHLDKLDTLLRVSIDIDDENGRLLRLTMDSKTLTGTIDAYINDGRILPVKAGKVIRNLRPVRFGDANKYTARVDSTMDILGIVTHMRDIKTDISYKPVENGVVIKTAMTDVPEILVEGAAFGFMPAGIIDIFLPTNIDELMREFMTVAVHGNGGHGIVTSTEFFQEAPGALATARFEISFEALNNFMVRIGMGIVSDRVIPNKEVSADIHRLIYDMEEAFSRDLDVYEKMAMSW